MGRPQQKSPAYCQKTNFWFPNSPFLAQPPPLENESVNGVIASVLLSSFNPVSSLFVGSSLSLPPPSSSRPFLRPLHSPTRYSLFLSLSFW
ncbi:hypothetical protein Ancab_036587 [Ancistrocladus abbreviatus]